MSGILLFLLEPILKLNFDLIYIMAAPIQNCSARQRYLPQKHLINENNRKRPQQYMRVSGERLVEDFFLA